MPSGVEGLVDAALTILVEARRRSTEGIGEPLAGSDMRRLNVAITAAHTVLEPPAMPTDELRAMGLWWDGGDTPGEDSVTLTRDEATAVFNYIQGDAHMIAGDVLNAIMAKVAPEGF